MLRPTRLDYCHYLLSTPINYTLTHFVEHSEILVMISSTSISQETV